MGSSSTWFGRIRRKFGKSSQRNIVVVYANTNPISHEESPETGSYEVLSRDSASSPSPPSSSSSSSRKITRILTKEEIAANKIQTMFRGHLARQAFRALRSLVKLQALVRGVIVRKQARVAMQCMRALVQLQVKVRARQLLNRYSDARSITA